MILVNSHGLPPSVDRTHESWHKILSKCGHSIWFLPIGEVIDHHNAHCVFVRVSFQAWGECLVLKYKLRIFVKALITKQWPYYLSIPAFWLYLVHVLLSFFYHSTSSPVLAPFFLRSSLRSGGLGPTREKMGPALIACACASFYPKNLVKDLEWPSKPPTRFIQLFKMLVSVIMFFPGICRPGLSFTPLFYVL